MREKTYLIKLGEGPWRVVSKEEWVCYERRAGFYNTSGEPNEPATAAFTGGNEQIHGRYTFSDDFDYPRASVDQLRKIVEPFVVAADEPSKLDPVAYMRGIYDVLRVLAGEELPGDVQRRRLITSITDDAARVADGYGAPHAPVRQRVAL